MRFFVPLLVMSISLNGCIQEDEVDVEGNVLIEKEKDVALDPGGKLQIRATYEERNKTYDGFSYEFSSDDESIATVDNNGEVTAVGVGFTNIYGSAFGFKSDPIMIKVVEDTAVTTETTIEEPTIAGLGIGQTLQLSSREANINNSTTEGNDVEWQSLDETIATVSSTGLVEGVMDGMVDIVVLVNESLSDTLTLIITSDLSEPVSISISAGFMDLVVDETLQLIDTTRNVLGDVLDDISLTWESSDEEVATVDANGVVTAVASGMATITASDGDLVSNGFTVMVSEADAFTRMATLEDKGYATSGTAILEIDGDDLNLHFVDFDSPLALQLPGVVVYLSNSFNAGDTKSNGLRIGTIPQSSGNFTMSVPTSDAASDFSAYANVFLICEPFTVSYGGGPFDN